MAAEVAMNAFQLEASELPPTRGARSSTLTAALPLLASIRSGTDTGRASSQGLTYRRASQNAHTFSVSRGRGRCS